VRETAARIGKPVIALFGALVFVNILMVGGESASTMILGHALAGATGGAWKYFAPFLGALGSFFSGSATISNLTFGGIQVSIAQDTGIDPATLLALQCAGAAMGNMICIHNIVAVCAVLSLANVEGDILKQAILPVALYGGSSRWQRPFYSDPDAATPQGARACLTRVFQQSPNRTMRGIAK
jgi:L-lactate permease